VEAVTVWKRDMIADAGTAPDAASAVTAQDGAACRRLWRSVLAEAILEAARDARARDWLRTADARLVADLAGVDAATLDRIDDALLDRLAAMKRRP